MLSHVPNASPSIAKQGNGADESILSDRVKSNRLMKSMSIGIGVGADIVDVDLLAGAGSLVRRRCKCSMASRVGNILVKKYWNKPE
jgi:hypothetical protein